MLARTKGDKVERFVLKYLTSKGLRLIEQNFNTRYGEIDLVMLDKATLVFVEVRFRAKSSHGSGAESVDYRKQQKIIKTAHVFLQQTKNMQQHNCRFDVVSVTLQHKRLSADWVQNAFQLHGW